MAHSSVLLLMFVALSLFVGLAHTQKPNITVAFDGTGNFRSIEETGVYHESVYIGNEKRNVIIFGDGMNKTIITFDKSNSSGVSTSDSATLNVNSAHFLAKDISIVNSAGPVIDTAIVIHNCTIVPTPELASRPDVKTYLGRPWKKFSRTIIMESYLDGFIDGEGWSKFDDKSDLSSLYYAEYNNRGKGAFTNGRVKWPGYHILKNSNDVKHFTVDKFINGSEWLPALDVPYIGGLIG
ncbi:hypothetical protein ACOSQ2_009168 [Xanthoceras sorbifolium]